MWLYRNRNISDGLPPPYIRILPIRFNKNTYFLLLAFPKWAELVSVTICTNVVKVLSQKIHTFNTSSSDAIAGIIYSENKTLYITSINKILMGINIHFLYEDLHLGYINYRSIWVNKDFSK